jgi:hypothetical protein
MDLLISSTPRMTAGEITRIIIIVRTRNKHSLQKLTWLCDIFWSLLAAWYFRLHSLAPNLLSRNHIPVDAFEERMGLYLL